ncbi:hypothetical protein [Howardella ureilytica]
MADIKNKILDCGRKGKDNLVKYFRFKAHSTFIDRSNGKKAMCMVLAGCKEKLFPHTLKRLKMFEHDKVDIVIVSSGKYVAELDDICKGYKWSYLWTKENDVSLVQNIAIMNHPKAKYIFKLDEDIFITKDYFDKMFTAYAHCKYGVKTKKDAFKKLGFIRDDGVLENPNVEPVEYNPGFIAPLIPLNGFGMVRIVKKLDAVSQYEKRFGSHPMYHELRVFEDPEMAKFLWGDDGVIPHVDDMNNKFGIDPLTESACATRFSIGAIMFERMLWRKMGGFKVIPLNHRLGIDEEQINAFCVNTGHPMMVSENIVVGHFSFGHQTEAMYEYMDEHPEIFK